MKKRSKSMLFLRVLAIMICFSFIVSRSLSDTLAKYTSSKTGEDNASVATFYIGANNTSTYITVPLTEEGTSYEFSIVNYNGSNITEVAYNYGFNISTLGNLPIKVTITPKKLTGQGTMATINGLVGENGIMKCNVKSEHIYTITIKWDTSVAGYNDYKYIEEIDLLIINYNCEQIN